MLLHVATTADWSARTDRDYRPDGYAGDGFVHCCDESQLAGVVDRYHQGRDDLVLLTIDPAGLTSDVVWEDTTGRGERFPHVYGPIPLVAVVAATPMRCSTGSSVNRT